MSLSDIAKCLFCVETLQAVLDQSRPLGPFGRCLLTHRETVVLVVVVVVTAITCFDNCTLAISQSQTFHQRLSLVSV